MEKTDSKIFYFEDNLPHVTAEVICVKCLHRFIDVRPTSILLKELECHQCGEKGYIIYTGQETEI